MNRKMPDDEPLRLTPAAIRAARVKMQDAIRNVTHPSPAHQPALSKLDLWSDDGVIDLKEKLAEIGKRVETIADPARPATDMQEDVAALVRDTKAMVRIYNDLRSDLRNYRRNTDNKPIQMVMPKKALLTPPEHEALKAQFSAGGIIRDSVVDIIQTTAYLAQRAEVPCDRLEHYLENIEEASDKRQALKK